MNEPLVLEALYTKVVNLHGRWYREVYIGSPLAWQFLVKVEIDAEQAAAER